VSRLTSTSKSKFVVVSRVLFGVIVPRNGFAFWDRRSFGGP
jgi:hypothetical protein